MFKIFYVLFKKVYDIVGTLKTQDRFKFTMILALVGRVVSCTLLSISLSLAAQLPPEGVCNVDSDCKICKHHEEHKCNQHTFKCECVKSDKTDRDMPNKSGKTLCNVDSDCALCKNNNEENKCNQMTLQCACVPKQTKTAAQIEGATPNMLAN